MSLHVPGFRNSYLGLGILHLSLLDLGKGTDPLYAVICSSYTLYYVERYVLRLHRWAGVVSGTAQILECAKVRRSFEIRVLFRNRFAISNLRSAISKLRNLQIVHNIYILHGIPLTTRNTDILVWETQQQTVSLMPSWSVAFKGCS